MPDGTVDSLELQFKTEATSATKSIDNLVKKLETLDSTVKGLDSGGLRKYAKEIGAVATALKNLTSINTSGIRNITKDVNSLSSIKSVTKDINDVTQSVKNLGNAKVNPKIDVSGVEKAKSDLNDINKAIDNALGGGGKTVPINIDTSAAKDVEKAVNAALGEVNISPNIEKPKSKINVDDIFDSTEFQKLVDEISTGIGSLNIPVNMDVEDMKQDLSGIQKLAAQYKEELRSIMAQSGFDAQNKDIIDLVTAWKQAESAAKSYQNALKNANAVATNTPKAASAPKTASVPTVSATSKSNTQPKNSNLGQTVPVKVTGLDQLKMVQSLLGKASAASQTFSQKVASAFRKAGSAAGAFSNSVKGIASAVKSPISALGKLRDAISGTQKQMGEGFGMGDMIGMSILFSAVFGAMAALQQAIVDGSNNLVQYSNTYNKSISSIVSSLLYLKNAWAAAFAPIVNVVAPYISAFIDMLASAMNALGKFFAALTGKSYTVQATKAMVNYAKTLDKTTKSTNKSTKSKNKNNKATKKLTRSLMSFDKINRLDDPDKSSSSTTPSSSKPSSGSTNKNPGMPAISEMFTTKKVEGALADFAKRLRKAFLAGDWYGLGKIIADGINSGMQKIYDAINWGKVGPKITKFCNAFTETMNSLVSNINWTLMGKTVGAGINTIVNTLNLLITGFNWKVLGYSFADGINGLFNEVNWENLGALLGNKIMIIWNTLYGFVSGLDYATIGKSFAQGVNGIFSAISFPTIAMTISTGLNGIRDILNNFTSTVNWYTIASDFASGVNLLVTNTDWAGLAESLSNAVMNVLGAIRTAVQTIDWNAIGQSIGEFLGNIDWVGVLATVFSTLLTVFSGLISGLFSTGSGKVFLLLLAGLKGIQAAFKLVNLATSAVEWMNQVTETLGPVVSKIGPKIAPALTKVGTTISNGLTVAVTKGLPAIGGALSGAASAIVNGFVGVISTAVKGLSAVFTVLTGPVGIAIGVIAGLVAVGVLVYKNWDTIKEKGKQLVDFLGKKFSDFIEGLKGIWEGIKGFFGPIIDTIGGAISGFISGAKDKFNELKDGAKNTFDNIKTFAGEKWTDIRDTVSNAASSAKDGAGKAWDTVKSKTTSAFESARQTASTKWSNLKNSVSTAATGAKDLAGKAWNYLKSDTNTKFANTANFAKKGMTTLKNSASTLATNAKNSVGKTWDTLKSKTTSAFGGMANGVKKAFTNLKNSIGSIVKKVGEAIVSPIKKAVNGVIGGVNWILDKVGSKKQLKKWGGVKFAKGSSGLPADTMGVVNDQKGATYKEMIVPPSGKPYVPEGRNVMLPLEKGTKIMPAKQTKEFLSKMPHFKSGIGDFFSGAWEKVKSFTGNVWDYITNPKKIVQIAIDKFTDLSGVVEPMISIAKGMVSTTLSGVTSFVKKIFDTETTVNYNPSKGVSQWKGLATKALQITGQYSAANLKALLNQMQHESGGNPKSINNWDINAKNGTPSKGLMQVIDPTFKAYAKKPYNKNIWDPLSNMIAAIRYTVSRYGSLYKGWTARGYKGYATGGFPKKGELFKAYESGPELVGRTGNKNVVANNNQIIEGIERGVYRAVTSAITNNNQNGNVQPAEITFEINGRKFVQAIVPDLERESQRKGGLKIKLV